MVLTDKEIRKLCEESNLILPFSEDNLQSESYDLTIENTITTFKKELKCIDITNQKDIDDMYEEKTMDSNGYILSPKEYVLVHVNEKITLPNNTTAHIRPRTRFTRLGLIVSDQHCNSTYEGKLKLGIFNATDYAMRIIPGVKIAQIVFEELSQIPSEHKQYTNKNNAAYHKEDSFRGSYAEKEADRLFALMFGDKNAK